MDGTLRRGQACFGCWLSLDFKGEYGPVLLLELLEGSCLKGDMDVAGVAKGCPLWDVMVGR